LESFFFFFFSGKSRFRGSACWAPGDPWPAEDVGLSGVEFSPAGRPFAEAALEADVVCERGISEGVIGGSVDVMEKLSANNKDAVGAKLEPTIAAPLTEVVENGKANRPGRRMRNVPLGDIRGDSTLVHEPVSKRHRAATFLVDSPEALAEIVRQNEP
jgi:hypothetical protein